jgi:GT2 family glycosyltransferase
MTSSVDVSVIVPTHRREHEVVHAVRSALRQRGVEVEVLVLDDASDGGARGGIEALGDPRVRYVRRATSSGGRPALVRNEGAALARGRYLHFLDDDDLLEDGALDALVGALDARPDAGVAIGRVVPFGDDPAWLEDKRSYFEWAATVGPTLRSRYHFVAQILFRGTIMVNSACLIRRECFAPVGGFDPEIPVYEDVEFFTRAVRRFGFVYVDRPILNYRTGAPSLMHALGHDNAKVAESYAIICRKYRAERGPLEYYALHLLGSTLRSARRT